MVSLKSPSSVDYGMKKNIHNYFYSHFPEFSPKISSILLTNVKIVNNNTVDFIFKDKKHGSLFFNFSG